MRMRALRIIVGGLLGTALLVVIAVTFLVRTEAGAGWILDIAQGQVEGFQVEGHSGSLSKGLNLREVRFSAPGLALQADGLSLAVDTDWFPFVLRLETLGARNLVVQILEDADESASSGLPDSLELPFRLEAPDVRISELRLLDSYED